MRYEVHEHSDLVERARGVPHLERCLEAAIAAKNKSGCQSCNHKEGPLRLACQYSAKAFGPPLEGQAEEKPANIVAVAACKSGGKPVLVQAMSGSKPQHCARNR